MSPSSEQAELLIQEKFTSLLKIVGKPAMVAQLKKLVQVTRGTCLIPKEHIDDFLAVRLVMMNARERVHLCAVAGERAGERPARDA